MQQDVDWLSDPTYFMEKVAINSCKAWELSKAVPGIGIILSNRIIDERKKNDWFNSWEDLQKRVYGIGPKLIQKMKAHGVLMTPTIEWDWDSHASTTTSTFQS